MNDENERLVFLHGFSQEEAVKAMRAVKAALNDQSGIAFAMSTPSNIEWPVKELIEHVLEEHREMTRPSSR